MRSTAPFNLAGLPALPVPRGYDSTGLPIGPQVMARPFDQSMVFRVGAAYERATRWHHLRPPVHVEEVM